MNLVQPVSAKESIHAALEGFIIALKVSDAVDQERWNADELKKHMQFRGQGEPLWIAIHHHKVSQEELRLWADNMVYYTAAKLAISTDSALDEVFGPDRPKDPDPERRAAICIIYMIRCSSAHNSIRPTWQCNPPYNQSFEVLSVGVKLDCASLHGKPVKASHYAGWVKFKLLVDYCLGLVEQQSSTNPSTVS